MNQDSNQGLLGQWFAGCARPGTNTQSGVSTDCPESNPPSPFSSRRRTDETKGMFKYPSQSQSPYHSPSQACQAKKTIQNNYYNPNQRTTHNISHPSSIHFAASAAVSAAASAAPSAAPTPASSHSLSSPSPSPQPTTPLDQPSLTSRIDSSHSTSKPVRIPHYGTGVHNSRDATPNLALDLELEFLNFDEADSCTTTGADAEMTTGPTLDSAVGRSRQDSFVSAGPKPISMINPNRENANRARRESLAGSMMNGMSWGGLSVGSFIRDE
jgi:hypothetical protein